MIAVPAEPGDAAAIKAFMDHVITTKVVREEPLRSEMVQNTASNVDWWLANPAETIHLKCESDGRIVGVVLVKNFWNLCSLFVAPEAQGQGLGRLLLESAVEACRGKSPKAAVWLNASPNAVTFYRHMGFADRLSDRILPPGFKAMQLEL